MKEIFRISWNKDIYLSVLKYQLTPMMCPLIVPSECNVICSASSGNCVLDGKVGDGDVHMSADKLGYWIHRHHAAGMKKLSSTIEIE